MKANIHPQWYPDAQVTCACGNTFTIGSTKQQIKVDICSKCHPFFTGQIKYIDTAGQVEKFQKKQATGLAKAADLAAKKAKKAQKMQEEKEGPKSLREMLMGS